MGNLTLTLPEALIHARSVYKTGKFTEAEGICLQIVSAKVDYLDALCLLALVNRANVLKQQRRFDEALGSYEQALSVRPSFVDAHYNRGIALHELGRPGEALDAYDRVLA
jgi:tetratricopeptide (TPR) repeat protein